MALVRSCPRCHTDLSADAPEGICPECLFRHAIDGRAEEAEHPTDGWNPSPGFAPPAPAELARHFPQLEVLALLGQGGMGAVYKARQIKLDRLVAIKVLPPEVARDPAFAERFTREARSLARLNHSNIVTVHDFGDADGLYYFTMEYVDGRNLRDLLESGALPGAKVLEIMPQICDALQYAHDEGLVHRDIKPENVLLDRRGRVKIADFGLAKLVGLTPAYLTLTGTQEVMGTLLYMAPEQMKRARTVDHRADIYSLGVVLYEMLTGELPLGRFAPPSHKVGVDERLDAVVLRALAREPAERYQDARAFKQDLEAALSTGTGPAPRGLSGRRGRAWPSARFEIHTEHVGLTAGGLIRRDENTLILEIEMLTKKKRFLSFWKGREGPHEVRIPLDDVASITYGRGWGSPPWSLILQMTRLASLAEVPGSRGGKIELYIPAEDRTAARRLVDSLALPESEYGRPGLVQAISDHEQARREVRAPAVGLLVTGVVTFLSWFVWIATTASTATNREVEPANLFGLIMIAALITVVSGVLTMGAVQMLRLRGYPLAATAAIAAMIPWSPGWLIGLPVGIWACDVLGKPMVTDAFLGDKRRAASQAAEARKSGPGIGGRMLSLFRSVGRYMLPTMPGKKAATGDQSSQTPPSTAGFMAGPYANDPAEGR
jgi:serine/threonine protein kinase